MRQRQVLASRNSLFGREIRMVSNVNHNIIIAKIPQLSWWAGCSAGLLTRIIVVKMTSLMLGFTSKTHLIEGESIPKSFLTFLSHSHSWKLQHERWQKQGIAYSWYSKVRYPPEFNKEVLSTFEYLKKHHSILIGKISKSENRFHFFRRNRT